MSNRLSEYAVERLTEVVAVDRSYSYDARHRLTDITDAAGADTSYSHDINGNRTRKTRNGQITTFVYDVRDRLVTVTRDATTLGRFRYNHAGLRSAKVDADGDELRYVYDGRSVLSQHDPDGDLVARYHYGPDRLLGLSHRDEGRRQYHHDGLGSVAVLTDPDGQVQARYQYDAWGNERRRVGHSANPFGYTGHERDDATGLIYMKARFYDPDVGRFLRADPYRGEIETPPSLHRYLYAHGNPLYYWDPAGLAAVVKGDVIGRLLEADDAGSDLSGVTGDAGLRTWVDAAGVGDGLRIAPESQQTRGTPKVTLDAATVAVLAAQIRATQVGDQVPTMLLVRESDETTQAAYTSGLNLIGNAAPWSELSRIQSGLRRGPGLAVDVSRAFRYAYERSWDQAAENPAQRFAEFAQDRESGLIDRGIGLVTYDAAAYLWTQARLAMDASAPAATRNRARVEIGLGAILSRLGYRGGRGAGGVPNSTARSLGSDVPYAPHAARQQLETVHGAGNVTSTTVPPLGGRNVHLAGQRHPVTGVVFDQRGFPTFDDVARFDTRLPVDQFREASYTQQMQMATSDLAEAIGRGQARATNFTDAQLQQIRSSSPRIDGYSWHHHQDTGRMQLVPRDIHKRTGHLGWEGMSQGR